MSIPTFIETTEQLHEACQFLAQFDAVAVDTEFVWQRTYFPQLGIIQLGASPEHSFIVDVVAVDDPSPLKKLMEDTSVVKIFHDAHQDIVIINQYINGTVSSVFDTQRVAGFTGRGRSLSLDKLILEFTGIQLDKSETRTNWLQRPLDPKQIEYALDDVRYLPQLRKDLLKIVDEYGNRSFVADEMLCFENIIPFDIEEVVEKQFKKGAGRAPARFRDRIYRLTLWREDVARNRDRPREHMLRKDALSSIACSSISSVEELASANILSSKTFGRYGKSIIDALTSSESPSRQLLKGLQRAASDTSEMVTLISVYQAFLHSLANNRGIDPTLLFNKAGVASLVRKYCKNREFPQVSGWRGEFITTCSEQFLSGKVDIAATPLPEEDTK